MPGSGTFALMIHSTANVDPRATLAANVRVGPYAVIDGNVSIGAGTVIDAHSVVRGSTIIGENCKIGPAAYVGTDPQHMGYNGEETWLRVGDGTVVREGATLHRATKPGIENATRVGQGCLIMSTAHVAHDCVVGNQVVLANGVLLGGHVTVGDRAFLGGGSVVHQFVRIGRLALVRGNEAISKDLPPFAAVAFGGLRAYNAVGVRRSNMSAEAISALRTAFRKLHTIRTLTEVIRAIEAIHPRTDEVGEVLEFLTTTKRGILISRNFATRSGDYDE